MSRRRLPARVVAREEGRRYVNKLGVDCCLFSVYELPKSINKLLRRHFRVRGAERDRWTGLIVSAMKEYGARPMFGPFRLHVTFHVATRRRWDASNHVKSILDALVRAGAIEDDGAPLCVLESYSVRLDPLCPRTEISITKAEAPAWAPDPTRRRRAADHGRSKVPVAGGVRSPARARARGAAVRRPPDRGAQGEAPAVAGEAAPARARAAEKPRRARAGGRV